MEKAEKIITYDDRRKILTIVTKHELVNPNDRDTVVGDRVVTEEYGEEGIREMIAELNKQKNGVSQQQKTNLEQLAKLGEVEVD